MPLRLTLRFFILILSLTAIGPTALGDPTNFSGLRDTDLKPSATLADLARELFSSKKGKIARVHVTEDRAGSLTVQIAYSGLETSESMVLTGGAEDSRHRVLAKIEPGRATLSATEGEVTVKLTLGDVPGGTKLDQSFLAVQIGKEGVGKKAVIKAFRCPKTWEKGLAPEEMKISVVAEPIGKSKTLPGSKTVTIRPFTPKIFATVKPLPTTSPADRTRPVVKAIPKTAAVQASSISTTSTPTKVTINPALIALRSPSMVLGLPKDVKDNNGKGPSANAIRLFDALVSDVGLDAEDIVDLHPNIYEDANPDSGYFYYLPRGYYLYWDEDTGYALRMLYGVSAGEANPNTVSVAARLTSGIDVSDITLVRSLLQKYCDSTGRKWKEIKPFPFNNMAVSLKGDLGQYSIPAERVSVTGITDIAGMIDISLTTDPVTKENLQMVLTQGLGINGTVTYTSASESGDAALEITVPVLIKFADRHSFGMRSFARDVKVKNASLYPMKLKHVNVLVSEAAPTVYSYDLSDTIVPSAAGAAIDGTKIPKWLDSSAIKMWVEYAVVGDDEAATAKAIDTVTGGVTSVAQSEITFRTLTPLADTGVSVVLVTVASKYFDARASGEVVKTVELTQDGGTFKVGPIYLVDRQPGQEKPGDPLFKFKLTVVKADGTTKEGAEWTESNNLTVYIGTAQLRPIVGEEPTGGQ
jgi:hypothetical protein